MLYIGHALPLGWVEPEIQQTAAQPEAGQDSRRTTENLRFSLVAFFLVLVFVLSSSSHRVNILPSMENAPYLGQVIQIILTVHDIDISRQIYIYIYIFPI